MERKAAKKQRTPIYDKPISIPVPFEDTLRDLLVTPEPKDKKKVRSK